VTISARGLRATDCLLWRGGNPGRHVLDDFCSLLFMAALEALAHRRISAAVPFLQKERLASPATRAVPGDEQREEQHPPNTRGGSVQITLWQGRAVRDFLLRK
jgi:hypothetical protein